MSASNNAIQTVPGYDISITARNVDLTEGLRTHVLDKVSKIDRFTDRVIDMQVVLDVQKIQHRCDIMMRVGNLVIKGQAISDDLYASIDRAVSRIQKQLRRYKSRVKDHHAKSLATVDLNINVLSPHFNEEVEEVNDAITDENLRQLEEDYKPHSVVATETVSVPLLSTDEAIMRLELSGESFMLYRCEADQAVKVMHRLPDGNFGEITPQ
jgi:putative sigma-54 modulation protein